ncbi:MAG: hypothetical protein R6U17_05860 [Thermoplasmata archaeon]
MNRKKRGVPFRSNREEFSGACEGTICPGAGALTYGDILFAGFILGIVLLTIGFHGKIERGGLRFRCKGNSARYCAYLPEACL